MNVINSCEILLSRGYIWSSFEDFCMGLFCQGQQLCWACFLTSLEIPSTLCTLAHTRDMELLFWQSQSKWGHGPSLWAWEEEHCSPHCWGMQSWKTHCSASQRSQDLGISMSFLFLTTSSIKNMHSRESYYFLFTGVRDKISDGVPFGRKILQARRLQKSLKQESFLSSIDSWMP